ncbi:MAG: adenosylcobinamide-phosphate synthase CbiB [Pseudomonadota bacterium]
MSTAEMLLIALLLDAILGEPKWLWSRVPHPIVVMGKAIATLDRRLNRGARRRIKGVFLMIGLCLLAGMLGAAVARLPGGDLWSILLTAILLAQKSLADHVNDVARGLEKSLEKGRQTVGKIVGRDTTEMDTSAVARAAIESAAENQSDGVVAPAIFFLLFGLPGLLIYKITNTADSMIGYRTVRYEAFGWAAARLDDLLNLAPARLTALFFAAVSGTRMNFADLRTDARLHRSPNAGWPEAAMARGLDVALSGPRSYDGEIRDFPYVNAAGKRIIGSSEVNQSVTFLWRSWAVLTTLILGIAAIMLFLS